MFIQSNSFFFISLKTKLQNKSNPKQPLMFRPHILIKENIQALLCYKDV